MYLGKIVEIAAKRDALRPAAPPLHPGAALGRDPRARSRARARKRIILQGDVPSPINPPPAAVSTPAARTRRPAAPPRNRYCARRRPAIASPVISLKRCGRPSSWRAPALRMANSPNGWRHSNGPSRLSGARVATGLRGHNVKSARHHRRRLDLDPRRLLHQSHHLHQRHGADNACRRFRGRLARAPSGWRDIPRYRRHTRSGAPDAPVARRRLRGSALMLLASGAPARQNRIGKRSSASQPITPPVTTIRPSAAMPLA